MGEVLPLPHRGETFLDPRGEGRSIRISGHRGAATIVLSIWQHGECRATFRLAGAEVDGFIRALLAAAPPSAPTELRSVRSAEPAAGELANAPESSTPDGPALAGDEPAADPAVRPVADPGIESVG